jgi:hypothetical protein
MPLQYAALKEAVIVSQIVLSLEIWTFVDTRMQAENVFHTEI